MGTLLLPVTTFYEGCIWKRSRWTRFNKFSFIAGDVLCAPEEVFDVFVDISDDLMLEKESFRALLSRAGAL